MTRRRRRPSTPGRPWTPGDEEACPTCESNRVLTGPIGRRLERTCCECGDQWTAPA